MGGGGGGGLCEKSGLLWLIIVGWVGDQLDNSAVHRASSNQHVIWQTPSGRGVLHIILYN